MKATILPILAGSLLLAAGPAFAASGAGVKPEVKIASAYESAATRYLNEADVQFNDWSRKMADLDKRVWEKSTKMTTQAKASLDQAWDNLKRRWSELRTANAEEWESARASWSRASERMQEIWRQTVPQQG